MRDIFKLLIFLMCFFGLIFCASYVIYKISRGNNIKAFPQYKTNEINIAVFDGCEYIANRTANGLTVLTHKGNCTNSIHIYNVEKK